MSTASAMIIAREVGAPVADPLAPRPGPATLVATTMLVAALAREPAAEVRLGAPLRGRGRRHRIHLGGVDEVDALLDARSRAARAPPPRCSARPRSSCRGRPRRRGGRCRATFVVSSHPPLPAAPRGGAPAPASAPAAPLPPPPRSVTGAARAPAPAARRHATLGVPRVEPHCLLASQVRSSPLRHASPSVLRRLGRRGARLHDAGHDRRVADGDADAVGAHGRAGADGEHGAVAAVRTLRRRAGGYRRPPEGHPGHAGRAARRPRSLLGAATLFGVIGPVALLAFTFLIGAGFTFYLPAQQASVNDLVARRPAARGGAGRGRVQRRARRRSGARRGDRRRIGLRKRAPRERGLLPRDDLRAAPVEEPPTPGALACRRRCSPASRAACATRATRRRCAR